MMETLNLGIEDFIEALKDFEKGWLKISEDFLFEQKNQLQKFYEFSKNYKNIFDRELEYGHITGSGFVISEDFSHLLMTYHKKLDKWIQLGGHCDSDPKVSDVALRECQEESGLNNFEFYPFKEKFQITSNDPFIFDIDCHLIPEYKGVKEHYHFDVRYLLIADRNEPLVISHESKDLKWLPIDEVLSFNPESSIERPIRKIKHLQLL